MGSTVALSPDTNDLAAQLRRNLLGESLQRDGVIAHRDEGGDTVFERHQHGKDEQAVSEPGHTRRSRRICASRTTANREDAGGGITSGRKQSVLGLDRAGAEKAVVLRLHLVNAGVKR
jgi:hypothetical protein